MRQSASAQGTESKRWVRTKQLRLENVIVTSRVSTDKAPCNEHNLRVEIPRLVPLIGYETAAKAAKLMMEQSLGVLDALAAIGVTEATVPGLTEAIDPATLARGNG